jgi:hypothetical protein
MEEATKKSSRQGRGGDGLHRKRPGGNWYFYHGRKPNGRPNEVSTGTKGYSEALTFRSTYIRRSEPMRVGRRTTFEEVAQNWKETKDSNSAKTMERYLSVLESHLLPNFGPMAVRDINAVIRSRHHR